MTQGQFISTYKDARLYAVAVGLAWFYWRRGMFGTIERAWLSICLCILD
jgi:hypothetical protein